MVGNDQRGGVIRAVFKPRGHIGAPFLDLGKQGGIRFRRVGKRNDFGILVYPEVVFDGNQGRADGVVQNSGEGVPDVRGRLFFLTASACAPAVFGKDAVGAAIHEVLDVAQVPPVIVNPDVPALGGSFKGMFQVDGRADEQGFPAPDDFHYFPFFKRAGGKPGDRRAEGDGGSPEGQPVVGRAFGHVQEVGGRYVKGFHRGRPRVKL